LPPNAGKNLIFRRFRRFNAFLDTPLLCSGIIHWPNFLDNAEGKRLIKEKTDFCRE